MAFLWLGIFAFFGYFGWWLLVPILCAGLAWDAWSSLGRRYVNFHRQRQYQPREAELLKASHGCAVLAICGLVAATVGPDAINGFIGGLIAAPENPWHFGLDLAFAGLVLWGLTWSMSGI